RSAGKEGKPDLRCGRELVARLFRLLFLLMAGCILTAPLAAQPDQRALPPEGALIEDIRIEGTNRTAPTQVLTALALREGEPVRSEGWRRDLQNISDLRDYDPIATRLSWEQTPAGRLILTITVKENPVVAEIEFVGNVKFSES